MSHFSKMTVQIKKQALAADICRKLGYTREHVDCYENPWKASNERVHDCTLYKKNGRVAFVVDKQGNVIHDSWSMGNHVKDFLKEYSTEFIKRTARAEGATVVNKGIDAEGSLVLEIEYGM